MATSIIDYASLQAQMKLWLDRTDLDTQLPEFIALVENDINRELLHRSMEQRAYTTMVAGTKKYASPTASLSFRSLAVEQGTSIYPLTYRTPQALAQLNNRASNGIPQWYTLVAEEIEVSPPPDAAYTLRVAYIKQVPSLDSTTTTNWLIDDHPDVYLHGALKEAWRYVRNPDNAAYHGGEYEKAKGALFLQDWNSQLSGSALEMTAG